MPCLALVSIGKSRNQEVVVNWCEKPEGRKSLCVRPKERMGGDSPEASKSATELREGPRKPCNPSPFLSSLALPLEPTPTPPVVSVSFLYFVFVLPVSEPC